MWRSILFLACAAGGYGQSVNVTALTPVLLSPSLATGLTVDTSSVGSIRVSYGGVSGNISMEFLTTQVTVAPCGAAQCMQPTQVRVRHNISGLRQVAIIVDGSCTKTADASGFLAAQLFTCTVSSKTVSSANEVGVEALISLQKTVSDPVVTFSVRYRWQLDLAFCGAAPQSRAGARAAGCELPDLAIHSIQVNQGVQVIENTVPLIRGKAGVLRVILVSKGSQEELTGINGSVIVNGRKIAPAHNDRVVARKTPQDGNLSSGPKVYGSLDFPLNESDTDSIDLRIDSASVWLEDGSGKRLDEVTMENNKTAAAIIFPMESEGSLAPRVIGIRRVCHVKDSGEEECPPANLDWTIDPYFPQIKTRLIDLPFPKVKVSGRLETEALASITFTLIKQYYRAQALSSTFGYFKYPQPDQVIFLYGNAEFTRGETPFHQPGGLNPFWFAWAHKDCPDCTSGLDLAHGIAHNLGLADSSTFPDEPEFPHRGVWWNPHTYPPDYNPLWEEPLWEDGYGWLMKPFLISPPTPGEYNALRLFSSGKTTASLPGRAAGEVGETGVFSGWVAGDNSSGFLEPAFHAQSGATIRASSGDTCLRFFPSGADYCFAAKLPTGGNKASFAVMSRIPAGTQRVALVRAGRELAELRTGTPAQLAFLAPVAGETWQGVRKIRWSSSQSQAIYRLDYSPDGGTSWLPIVEDLTTTEYDLNTDDILGGDIRFRIMAASGLDTSSAISPPVRITQSPRLTLSSTAIQFRNTMQRESDFQTITIRNAGSGQLLVNITAPGNPVFTVETQQALQLPAGGEAPVKVRFTPTGSGDQQSSFRINDQTVTLRGSGFTDAAPNVETSPIDLGQVEAGKSKTVQARVLNTGESSLTVTSVSISGAGLVIDSMSLPRTVSSGDALLVSVRVTAGGSGAIAGTLTISSNDPAKAQAQVPVTATVVNGPVPSATASAVLNAANYKGDGISPGEIVTIFTTAAGPPTLAGLALDTRGFVATEVATTKVYFNGIPAPIIYTLASQVSVVVPYNVARSSVAEIVIEYQGRRSDVIRVPVVTAVPGLFSANSSGTGQGAILNQDNSVNSAQKPAAKGSVIVLFGTGEGLVNPAVANGSVTAGVVNPILPVSVTIGGVPQKVLYAGAAPGLVAGVLQVNVEIAANTPGGSQPVIVKVGDASSQAGLTVAIAGGTTPQPVIGVTPTSLDFGNVTAGQVKDLTVTVRNTGTATLTVNSIASSNPRFAAAVLSPPFNVGVGSSQTATIRFSPTAAGGQNGTVTINSTDPSSPAVIVTVSGTGTTATTQAPVIVLEPTSLDFGAVNAGQTKDLTVTVRNTGTVTLIVSSITSNNARFAMTLPSTPFNVGAGSFQTVTIRFSPVAAGVQTGTLTFASNDPANPSRALSVTGSGAAGSGGATNQLTLTSAVGIPSNRTSNQVPALAIDGNTSTYTWTAESGNTVAPSYLAVSLGATAQVSRLRIYKDNDSGGAGPVAKNLIIEYTNSDPSIPLASRTWTAVSGLTNGFNGTELLTATSVNANGTVTADNHNSLTSGFASLTFTPVNATGLRIGFSNATSLAQNAYRVYELQLY